MRWLILALFAHAALGASVELGEVKIISSRELDPELSAYRVLDAREKSEYRKGHISGSLRVDWKDWTEERPNLLHSLFGNPARWGKVSPDGREVEKKLRLLGLSNDTPVVVVGMPHGWGEEGRIAWNLLYWGSDKVFLLDGGFPGWKSDPRRRVSTEAPPSPPPGMFQLRTRSERRAEILEVKKALAAKTPLLDTRSTEEYSGKEMSGQKRGGHLPGARLTPALSLYAEDGRYLSGEKLKKLVGDLTSGRPIAYCVGGVRSALLALLVEARLGVRVANYDGSIWEWSRDPSAPLEK